MADHNERRKIVRAFRDTVIVQHPDSSFYAVVATGEGMMNYGVGNTGDNASFLEAVCQATQNDHVFGRCGHCDRMAMAIAAARRAFRLTLGDERLQCGETAQ